MRLLYRQARTNLWGFMKLVAIASFITSSILAAAILSPATCLAQRDPEAAARQAEIDADEARSKIEDLQAEQVAAGDVQNETTAEMSARDNQIQEYENYQGKPEQIKKTGERVKARRMMVKAGKAAKGDGKEQTLEAYGKYILPEIAALTQATK